MKVHVIVAAIALSGFSGLATAEVMLPVELPLDTSHIPALSTPQSTVFVLEPVRATAAGLSATQAPSLRILTSTPADLARAGERVTQLPTHLLLPDGALLAANEPTDVGVLARGVALPPGTVAGAGPSGPHPLERTSSPASGAEVAPASQDDAASPTFAPAPERDGDASVFEPRLSASGSPRTILIGGGIAIGALSVLGVLLYHRIRPHAALENETRKLIFNAVCSQPGLGVHEISRMAGVSYSTATYHLERLIGAGMIVMTPDGNKLCYYKNGGAFSESERRILPLIKNEEAAKLFEAILIEPGTYRAALAQKLGVTATTINWHLRRLRDAGLVNETREGRSAHLYARLDDLRPTFLTLAVKVEGSEPIVAEKLRRFAGDASSGPVGVGAA